MTKVCRTKTMASPCKGLATFKTATHEIRNIPLDVDYATEIEPFLGSLLVTDILSSAKIPSDRWGCREREDSVKSMRPLGKDSPLPSK